MGRRATKVPRVPVCTQPRDPPLTGYPQLPQPSISRPLQRSKDVQTHLLQLPLARTPMNGERLCGLLCHMRSCKVTKAQTLWEVETAADTIQTIVGGISVHCKTRLQVPDSRVRAWSQQSCLRRDKIQYFGKVLQNSPLTSHKMRLNRAILTMTLPCQ